MTRITPVVLNLIITNAIIFFGLRYGLNSLGIERYTYLQSLETGGFNPYQLFTSMFMHANEKHLIMNMLTLFFLGPITEQTLGGKRFLMLYITAGLVGGIVYVLTSSGAAVGASGAINGVVVAFATMYPTMKLMVFPLPVPIQAKYLVTFFVLIDFFFGVTSSRTGIAHYAHLGGALAGFLMIKYWKMDNLR